MTARPQFITLGPVTVGLLGIDRAAAESRREAERRAVAAIVAARLGAGSRIEHRADGSPCIPGYSGFISVSHSREIAAVAFDAEVPVGIDIESLDRGAQLQRVAPRVLSDGELKLFGGSPDAILQAWTLKEALYKVAGDPGVDWRTGLQLPRPGSSEAQAGKYICEVVAAMPLGGHALALVRRNS